MLTEEREREREREEEEERKVELSGWSLCFPQLLTVQIFLQLPVVGPFGLLTRLCISRSLELLSTRFRHRNFSKTNENT